MKDYDKNLLINSDSKIKKSRFKIKEPDKEYKTLDDFKGNDNTKNKLEELISRISFPELYTSHGVSIERGILLEGEPGNGKTFSIECIQGELYRKGKIFGVMEYSIGNYGSKYINENSVTMNKFFETGQNTLKENPKISGIIYFFDEANSLMTHRNNQHQHKEDNKVLETLMMNMQNIHNRESPEYMFFATNFKGALDKASIREGRIDLIIHYTNPKIDSRKILFEKEIKRINSKSGYQILPRKVSDDVLEYSEGLSCIDCIQIIDKVARSAINEGIKKMTQSKSEEIFSVSRYIKVKKENILKQVKEIKKDKEINKTPIGFQINKEYTADIKKN